eukprot:TRINITY_DN4397_c0_g3_i1.p1 TRINITY_DN4397_c0_g3~~TRINITY_DN4397_c0_g3_i1.p1  ORF type:complete len:620 (-),score=8.09 TRINITY_DN4397_c0_g3_i1:87-1778(-)
MASANRADASGNVGSAADGADCSPCESDGDVLGALAELPVCALHSAGGNGASRSAFSSADMRPVSDAPPMRPVAAALPAPPVRSNSLTLPRKALGMGEHDDWGPDGAMSRAPGLSPLSGPDSINDADSKPAPAERTARNFSFVGSAPGGSGGVNSGTSGTLSQWILGGRSSLLPTDAARVSPATDDNPTVSKSQEFVERKKGMWRQQDRELDQQLEAVAKGIRSPLKSANDMSEAHHHHHHHHHHYHEHQQEHQDQRHHHHHHHHHHHPSLGSHQGTNTRQQQHMWIGIPKADEQNDSDMDITLPSPSEAAQNAAERIVQSMRRKSKKAQQFNFGDLPSSDVKGANHQLSAALPHQSHSVEMHIEPQPQLREQPQAPQQTSSKRNKDIAEEMRVRLQAILAEASGYEHHIPSPKSDQPRIPSVSLMVPGQPSPAPTHGKRFFLTSILERNKSSISKEDENGRKAAAAAAAAGGRKLRARSSYFPSESGRKAAKGRQRSSSPPPGLTSYGTQDHTSMQSLWSHSLAMGGNEMYEEQQGLGKLEGGTRQFLKHKLTQLFRQEKSV